MKNRRLAIIAFVLVAVMAIGIGYAAMSDQFSITGTITADENNDKFNEYVYFSAVTGTASNGASVDASNWIDATKDSITVTPPADSAAFKVVGDKLTIVATVKNDADIAVKLSDVSITNPSNDYLKVTITGAENDVQIAQAGGTTTITIVVEMIKTPTKLESTTFTIGFDVVPA